MSTVAAPNPSSAPGVTTFARAWWKAIAGTSYLPSPQADVESFLAGLTRRLAEALHAEPFSPQVGYEIGAELVNAHVTAADALGRTVEVIDGRLLRDLGLTGNGSSAGASPGDDALHDRLARLLGTVATGFARALRDRTLEEQETVRRAAMIARDTAERRLRESESRFRHQANHDPLTKLPNRALFTERLGRAVGEAAALGRRLGVCFVDLDGFKVVNDTLGHDIGDHLLSAVAQRLSQAVAGNLVARIGGDEFVVLVEDTTCTDDVLKVADATLASLADPVLIDGHEITVSASIGIVERPMDQTSPAELMRAADLTLHWAKKAGKGRWALFDAERNDRELEQYALARTMPAALDRREFFLEYQPLVSLADGSLRGVEALVRWQHPQRGVLPPSDFIGVAEETGLIVRLGLRALNRACEHAREWLDLDGPMPFVSVNLAVRQVHDAGLVGNVTAILDRTGLPPDRLQLEITESALMSTADEPVRALRALADLGIRIAIDDFGTGYSNLAYLKNLPVCELKVAGSFVEGLRISASDEDSATDERILATLVSLAHTLGLTVTAEGVETEAQAERLRALGCDAAQGWHFGRPTPPEDIATLLTR